MLKITEQAPVISCSQERIDKLNSIGFTTTGYIDQLQELVVKNGFNLPSEDNECFGFVLHGTRSKKTYTRIYLNFVDAMAEEILLLHEEGMLKYYKI